MEWYLKVLKQHYADFNGRARRQEYWMYTLFNCIALVVLVILTKVSSIFGILYAIYALGTLLPSLAVTVRRLHDIGKSGWFVLISLIPIVSLYLIYLLAQDSQPGTNEYGANPKGA
ncbi:MULTISPECIES: DUF805 domain-containing protein [Dyella]|uniref:DUF805 domain-containing protein n=1 Tax=Dyella TaxID=231454 RepID=UPI000C83AC3E|nr:MULTISPECIES: DUF805 domain-containing protein [Dyella]MDR3444004.1 DUF805 domain-containing protein [Dyella sp.]PMQ06264.1 Inner membrane protein YhaH [Dyella sp. AD56]ULU26151.1 DUF805 protein [Dyella terrae]